MKNPKDHKEKEHKDLKTDVDRLVTLGKSKGFLTYDEVNSALSDEVGSSEEIDQVFDILDGKDIKVIDTEDDADVETNASHEAEEQREEEARQLREEEKEENVYAERFLPLDDPVKMYLKQM